MLEERTRGERHGHAGHASHGRSCSRVAGDGGLEGGGGGVAVLLNGLLQLRVLHLVGSALAHEPDQLRSQGLSGSVCCSWGSPCLAHNTDKLHWQGYGARGHD